MVGLEDRDIEMLPNNKNAIIYGAGEAIGSTATRGLTSEGYRGTDT
jgi:hypothetical protein